MHSIISFINSSIVLYTVYNNNIFIIYTCKHFLCYTMYNVAVLHSLLYSHYVCVCVLLACLVGGLRALVANYSLRQSLERLILALVYTKSSNCLVIQLQYNVWS